MNDLTLWLKTHAYEVFMMSIATIGSIVVLFYLIKKPEKLGLKSPLNKFIYLLPLAPVVIFALLTWRTKTDSLSYPTGIDLSENLIFVKGITVWYRERAEDQLEIEEHKPQMLMFDKSNGKEIARFDGTNGLVFENKLFTPGTFGYHVVDLGTSKVLEVIGEDQIKKRIARFISEEIHSLEYSGGGIFQVRTVMDKSFTYHALRDTINVQDGYTLFLRAGQSPSPYTGKSNLFKPMTIAQAGNLTLTLSYDNLKQESFILSALDASGTIVWSKHDSEISSKLSGELFADPNCPNNIILDNNKLYFVNKHRLACISLETGDLVWISTI